MSAQDAAGRAGACVGRICSGVRHTQVAMAVRKSLSLKACRKSTVLQIAATIVAVGATTTYGAHQGAPCALSWSLGFSDGMVLERNRPVVYGQLGDGYNMPCSGVNVTLLDRNGHHAATVRAEVRNGDSFRAELPPQTKGWGCTVTASLHTGASLVSLHNVSFGEVVLCSGQSNVNPCLEHYMVVVRSATPTVYPGKLTLQCCADVATHEVYAHAPRVLRGNRERPLRQHSHVQLRVCSGQ